MYFDLDGVLTRSSNTRLNIVVTHNDESILFDLSKYKRTPFKNGNEVHNPLSYTNDYIQTLPEEIQQSMFNLYRDIYGILGDMSLPDKERIAILTEYATKLLAYLPYDEVLNWVINNPNIHIPASVKSKFDTNIERDNKGTREQTYIVTDYQHLLAFTIIIRLMLPVWAEYLSIKQNKDNRFLKYLPMLNMIAPTGILETPAAEKLRQYINKTLEKRREERGGEFTDLVLSGIPDEYIFDWLFSYLIIHKLTVCEYYLDSRQTNLITCVNKFLRNELTGNKIQGLRDKRSSSSPTANDVDKHSIYENYKIISDLTPGTQIELTWYAHFEDRFLAMNAPNIDKHLLELSKESAKSLVNETIHPVQVTLLKWITNTFIGYRSIKHLPKETIINLLGLSQAVMYHHGHKYLSLLMTAITDTDDEVDIIATTLDSKARVPKEDLAELMKWYPFHYTEMEGETTVTKAQTPIVDAVNKVTNDIMSTSWYLTVNNSLLEDTFGSLVRRPSTPYDLKIQVVRLLIDIGSRKWLPGDNKLVY